MTERKETLEKFGVIFVIWDGRYIQLEERMKLDDKFYGFTIIPGGGVENTETYWEALKREVKEEYGVKVVKAEEIGKIREVEIDSVINYRHVFLVTEWEGELANPEDGNHTQATVYDARKICKHPISQKILDLLENKLSGQNN